MRKTIIAAVATAVLAAGLTGCADTYDECEDVESMAPMSMVERPGPGGSKGKVSTVKPGGGGSKTKPGNKTKKTKPGKVHFDDADCED